MKKNIFVPGVAVFMLLGISVWGLNAVYAQDQTTNYPPIVQKLAERFNLNPSDVQLVFEENKDEHQAEMEARFADKLDQAIADGKLTEEKKQAILDKHEEIQNKLKGLKNSDFETRRTQMQQIHEDFQKWLKENNIDPTILGPMGMKLDSGFHKHQLWMSSEAK